MIVLATGGRQQVQACGVGVGADPPAPSQDRRHAGGAVLCYRQTRIDRKFPDRSVMPWAPLRPKVRLMQTCPGGSPARRTGRAGSFNEILCWIVPFLEIV